MDPREQSTREYRKQQSSDAVQISCDGAEMPDKCTGTLRQMCDAIEEIRTKVDRLDKRDALSALDDHNHIQTLQSRVGYVEKILHSFVGIIVLGTLSFIGAAAIKLLSGVK